MAYEIPTIVVYHDKMLLDARRIENYVTHHPKSRRIDISKELEILPNAVSSALSKMAKQGKVRRVRADDEWVWEPGPGPEWEPPEPKPNVGEPKQRTVSTWEPERRRDELTAALFGSANVDRSK